MTAKEYLQRVYFIDQRIKRLQADREKLRGEMFSLKSPSGNMTAEKVQASTTGDAILRLISKVDEAERDIVRGIEAKISIKKEIISRIEGLDDERYRMLLFDRYVLLYTWEQVSVDMNYRIKWVYKLHGNALNAFAEKYSDELAALGELKTPHNMVS